MAVAASLRVLLGCQFGSASKLLSAAEQGDEAVVQQVLSDKPQLAAFTGFHGTTSPLHRAAANGHIAVCRAIVEPLKQRARQAEAGAAGGRGAAAAKWRRLLTTVLNQRSHKSLTPLMLACEHGHAAVAAYLLREGADPLAADFVHSRSCLHYAAVGGHADCLRLLCSDSALVATPEGARPLREVIVSDMQVQACRFIDQRAFGGLTALHFAVVTGNLEAVQALLRGGASIMVKSDGEAYIGDDFLVPGSSPLHVAVIINNVSIVHAILQAHMEMMNILGTSLDERGRRPWEGTSRTDIRSVRNHFRKLPFHLARERHQPQLMSLVDPRIPIDVALDAARDTEHGIGPKRLSTICSLVLQRSLLQWLDNAQRELACEAAGRPPRPPGRRSGAAAGRGARIGAGLVPEEQAAEAAAADQAAAEAGSPPPTAGPRASPFAAAALDAPSSPHSPHPALHISGALSAPATPARPPPPGAGAAAGPATVGGVPGLEPAPSGGPQRMASLHGYMGLLSLKRPPSSAAIDSVGGPAGVRSLQRQLSGTAAPHELLLRHSGGATGVARVRFVSDPTGGGGADAGGPAGDAAAAAAAAAAVAAALVDPAAPGSTPESPSLLGSPRDPDRRIKVMPNHRRGASTGNIRLSMGMGMGGMFGARRRSGEATPPAPSPGGGAAASPALQAAVEAALALAGEKEKELALEAELEPDSPLSGEADSEDLECGVCLDAGVEVAFAACQHKLCLACARHLTQQNKKPPHCPFCRRLVVGFQRVSATGLHGGSGGASRAASGEHGATPRAADAP